MFVNAIRYRKEKDGHGWLYSIFGKRERIYYRKMKINGSNEERRRKKRKRRRLAIVWKSTEKNI
jgi:hypothetical protein